MLHFRLSKMTVSIWLHPGFFLYLYSHYQTVMNDVTDRELQLLLSQLNSYRNLLPNFSNIRFIKNQNMTIEVLPFRCGSSKCLRSIRLHKSIKTFDISTLYTTVHHKSIKTFDSSTLYTTVHHTKHRI